jgi:hypothetical protein
MISVEPLGQSTLFPSLEEAQDGNGGLRPEVSDGFPRPRRRTSRGAGDTVVQSLLDQTEGGSDDAPLDDWDSSRGS